MRSVRQLCPECDAIVEFVDVEGPLVGVCGACRRSIDVEWTSDVAGVATLNQTPPHRRVSDAARRPTVDEVFPPAMVLFRRWLGSLLGLSLCTSLVWFSLVAVPGAWLSSLWRRWNGDATGLMAVLLATVLFIGISIIVTAYSVTVMARATLEVARGTAGAASSRAWRLSVSPGALMRLTLLFGIVASVLGAVLLLSVATMVIAAMIWQAERAVLIGTMISGGVLMVVAGILQWWLWPAVWFIVDGRADLWHAVRWSTSLTWRFRRLSAALVVAYVVITTIGSLGFYVGQILTTPLAMMPLSVAYLRMTGGQNAFSLQTDR